MNDIGQLLLAVGIGVLHAEPGSQQHIDLDGHQSVFLAKDVLILNVQLGSVESSLVNAHGVLHTQIVQNLLHGRLCGLPLLGSALIFVLGVGGVPLTEPEGAVLQ